MLFSLHRTKVLAGGMDLLVALNRKDPVPTTSSLLMLVCSLGTKLFKRECSR